jgi:diadenylate cyclase
VPSFSLLMSLFDPHSPGHDGAVLIENGRAVSYAVRLPLSTTERLSDEYGTRHHAGMGLAESTDAFVIVVSEERGQVSLFHRGEMEILSDKDKLTSRIVAHWQTLPTFKKPGSKTSVLITEIVASFFLAVLFWSTVVLTQSELQQVEYRIPVVYSARPNTMAIVGERIDEISVQLLGRDSDLRRIDRSQLKVQVDLSTALPGKQKIVFTEKHIRLPRRVKLISTDPASVELILE